MNRIMSCVPVGQAVVHSPEETWRLLHRLSPRLLQQGVEPIPGGLWLTGSRTAVISDADAGGLLDHEPAADTVLISPGPYGLCADLWLGAGAQRRYLGGSRPWVDPLDGTLCFLPRQDLSCCVRLSLDGLRIPRAFPIADVLVLETGFESVELRLSQAWEAF